MGEVPEGAALALAEHQSGPSVTGDWIGALVGLGNRVANHAQRYSGRQLVIAVSVPVRDFAAVLIGCGWTAAAPAPKQEPLLEVLRQLEPRTPVRVVTEYEILSDAFLGLDEKSKPPRLRLSRWSSWVLDKVRAIAALSDLESPARQPRPAPGRFSTLAGLAENWDSWLCSPPADLVIAGARSQLLADLEALLMCDGMPGGADQLASLLLPYREDAATWSTRLQTASGVEELQPLVADAKAVVLDGTGAVKFLNEIEAPVVFAILDRSVADDTAEETVLQARNVGAEPLLLSSSLGWKPTAGIEAMAFTAAL